MRATITAVSVLTLLLVGGTSSATAFSSPLADSSQAPGLGHVFVIVLENENAEETFGPEAPRYLAETLKSQGANVPNYYATGHLSLDNYISMISGQAPNPQTQADCVFFTDFRMAGMAADGQAIGSGCVYPSSVQTVADQLETANLDWGGYMEDMAAKAPAEPATCRHPAIGSMDDTQSAEVGDQYATRHNPFMYFHSIIDEQASCDEHVVDYTKLAGDLKNVGDTPQFSFITPNLCHDGHDEPCVNDEPGGLVSANEFLEQAVPPILESPAFEHRGLLVVTFDEAEASGGEADSSACCNEQPGPNTPSPGGPTPGPGGGRIGAVMISPCIRPGTVSEAPYNHYSFLRSVEDGFGLPHLGYAGQQGLQPFGTDVYSRSDCGEKTRLRVKPRRPVAGARQAVRFKVRSRLERCRSGVIVSLGHRKAKTNARGRARLRVRVGAKPLTARATKPGCLPSIARVKPRRLRS